tara:strand:+ start:1178 stop:1675 length:498 start_codon:yes stop_codon:yes gene_type:complete
MLELEEVQLESNELNKKWNDVFSEYIPKPDLKNLKEEAKDKPTKKSIKKSKSPKLKKLYRKLSSEIHPDKGGTDDNFSELKNKYEDQDLIGLLETASKYNIKYDLDKSDIELFDSTISKLSKELNAFKTSLAYNFFNGDKNTKLMVINQLEKLWGTKIDIKKLDF